MTPRAPPQPPRPSQKQHKGVDVDQDLFSYLFGAPNVSPAEAARTERIKALRTSIAAGDPNTGAPAAPVTPPAAPVAAPASPFSDRRNSQSASTSLRTTVKTNTGPKIAVPELRPVAALPDVPEINFEDRYAGIDKRLAELDAPQDMTPLQAEARRRSEDGTMGLMLSLAAQHAGQGYEGIQGAMLKRAMAARDPLKFSGGTINEQGDVLNDPGYMQDKRREALMRERAALEGRQQAITTSRERDAARAAEGDRTRALQATIAAGQQGIQSIMAEARTTEAQAKRDAVTAKGAAGQPQFNTNQLLDSAEKLLPGATGSGIGTLANSVLGAVGTSTDKTKVDGQLKVISGYLTSAVPRMQGPQSNFDVLLYQEMAGRVGNTSVPVGDRLEAIKIMRQIHDGAAFGPNGMIAPPMTGGGQPAAGGGGQWSVKVKG